MASPPKQAAFYCRHTLAIVLFLWICGALNAQTVTPSVVNTNGFSKEMANGFISISVGESAIQTLNSSSGIITQGFLQPELEPPCSDFELEYYPNPVRDVLTVKDSACGRIINEIEVFDLLGNQVLRTRLINREANLKLLVNGVYIIRGYSLGGNVLGTFKIVKVQDR